MDIPDFSGPFGGVVATAFFSGCAAGFSFAKRTLLKMANERIEYLESKIETFESELALQDEKCEARLRESERAYDSRIKRLEDRMIQLEESRLNIALNKRGDNDINEK